MSFSVGFCQMFFCGKKIVIVERLILETMTSASDATLKRYFNVLGSLIIC